MLYDVSIVDKMRKEFHGGVEMKVVGDCREGFTLLARRMLSEDDWEFVAHDIEVPSYSHVAMLPMIRLLNIAKRIQTALKEEWIPVEIQRPI